MFEEAEDRVYSESLEVIEGVQMFWRLFGDEAACSPDPPEEWVDEFGPDRAEKLFKLAKAGMLTKNEVPMGVHVALAHAQSMIKAKTMKREREGSKTLNVGNVQIMFADPSELYPTRKISNGDDGK